MRLQFPIHSMTERQPDMTDVYAVLRQYAGAAEANDGFFDPLDDRITTSQHGVTQDVWGVIRDPIYGEVRGTREANEDAAPSASSAHDLQDK